MISLIQGTPGSGKSAVGTVDMLQFLLSGGVVACNYNLISGWHYKLAAMHPRVRWLRADIHKVANDLWSRAFKIGTHDTVMELSGKLRDILKVPAGQRIKEGTARLYIDEAQLLFNSRNWKDNWGFIEFLTQHRKLGWDVYIIAHAAEMIDKQIRDLIEFEYRLRNLQKVKVLGLFPLSPYPLFMTIVRYAGLGAGSGNIAWRRLYPLRPNFASLYDSMEVFAFDGASKSITSHGPAGIIQEKHHAFASETFPRYHARIRPG